MPGTKRKGYPKRPRQTFVKRPKSRMASSKKLVKLSRIVSRMDRSIELKQSNRSESNGPEITHNNFVELVTNLLATSQGLQDPMTNIHQGNRIGDEIYLRNLKVKMMLELNERFSDVTFRIMVVRCARNDQPTRATLFTGLSGNKMLDEVNTERYSILYQKYVKLTAPNVGTASAVVNTQGTQPVAGNELISRGTRIVTFSIKGTKFAKGGVIKYENASEKQKFFDYHLLCYAYSNVSTSQDVWNVGRVSAFTTQLFYKDA